MDASVEPAMVGLTEYAVSQLGELVFVDLPEPGIRVEAGDEIVELESQKAVQPLVCPVAGTVRYVNREASDDPGIITNDPYGEGWILRSNSTTTSPRCSPPRSTPNSSSDCLACGGGEVASKHCVGIVNL